MRSCCHGYSSMTPPNALQELRSRNTASGNNLMCVNATPAQCGIVKFIFYCGRNMDYVHAGLLTQRLILAGNAPPEPTTHTGHG